MKKVAVIAGARPNFMKIAPLTRAFRAARVEFFVVNTSQHFDANMSKDFFREFRIYPRYTLKPVVASPVRHMSHIMNGLEDVYMKERPDLVVVVGDVNSTLYGALAALKMNIPIAHVEAGLRSHNYLMPEEINRVLVDNISDLLFVTENDALVNLRKEGITDGVHVVGNIMIDTLSEFIDKTGKSRERFYFCTLHRAENVDNRKVFGEILEALEIIAKDATIYLPLHPRTKKMAEQFGFIDKMKNIFSLMPPLGYSDTVYYEKNAKLILTDSGGVQEEASFLGTPCLTLRTETERPITVKRGTNVIAGITRRSILAAYKKVHFDKKKHKIPLWDGRTSTRVANIIKLFLDKTTGH